MEKSVLKKEFSKKDVQRLRNIITGKTGAATQTLTGWEKKSIDHTEGDVWEEDGRTWTIKNGIKQNLTKLDGIKKLVVMPITCPNCGKHMKTNEVNKKMYSIHKMCLECVVNMEAKIKLEGKWEEYEKGILKANALASLVDFEKAVDAWYKEKDSFVSESGEVESWQGGDKTKMYEEIKTRLQEMKNTDIY
jgi:hypothetical protein